MEVTAVARYPDVRRRDHGHHICNRIGTFAESKNAVATVVDRKIMDRRHIDLSHRDFPPLSEMTSTTPGDCPTTGAVGTAT